MKKLFIIALFTIAISSNAQESKKEVPLTLSQHEFLLSVRKINSFKDLEVPTDVIQYSSCGSVLHSDFKAKYSTDLIFMPDGELRINRVLNNGYYTTVVYYLRFINGSVCGYFLGNKQDGSVVIQVIKNTNESAYDFTLKPVK